MLNETKCPFAISGQARYTIAKRFHPYRNQQEKPFRRARRAAVVK
jgi:hypothetical protein